MTHPSRLLIIRFSSFGDIVQAEGVPFAFREAFASGSPEPKTKPTVDWLVRSDFRGLLEGHPSIHRVIAFSRNDGLLGLLRLGGS